MVEEFEWFFLCLVVKSEIEIIIKEIHTRPFFEVYFQHIPDYFLQAKGNIQLNWKKKRGIQYSVKIVIFWKIPRQLSTNDLIESNP